MNKKILQLPLYTLLAGVALRIIDAIAVRILMGDTNSFTLEMNQIVFWIRLIGSLVAFVMIGLMVQKKYNHTEWLLSTSLLVGYSIVVLALEQVTQMFWGYNLLIYYLFLPVELFTILTSCLAKISPAQSIHWIYAVPALFAPYLFLLFSRKKISPNS